MLSKVHHVRDTFRFQKVNPLPAQAFLMPRRRSTKARASGGKPRPVNRSEGKIKKWDKTSDIPFDEEDQCALCCKAQGFLIK